MQSVWRITISFDIGQDKPEWQSVWRITISVFDTGQEKLNGNSYGELQYQL